MMNKTDAMIECQTEAGWTDEDLLGFALTFLEQQKLTSKFQDFLKEQLSSDRYDDTVAECVASGDHLTSCDNDGYCNFCGEQLNVEELGGVCEQWVFGDTESNLGVTIDVFQDGTHQPRIWHNGDIDNAAYFPKLTEAVSWIKEQLAHDEAVALPHLTKPEDIVGLAPIYNWGNELWEWTPVNKALQKKWREVQSAPKSETKLEINLFPEVRRMR